MGQEEEEEEGREIEGQLELQLQEQRDSLSAVEQALASDPSNSDLLEVSLFPSRQLFIHLTTQYFRLHRRERERKKEELVCNLIDKSVAIVLSHVFLLQKVLVLHCRK